MNINKSKEKQYAAPCCPSLLLPSKDFIMKRPICTALLTLFIAACDNGLSVDMTVRPKDENPSSNSVSVDPVKQSATLHYAVAQNFKQDGRTEWLALKYRSGIPLNDTGALRQSIDELSDNDTALVGTNMVYAAIHQFGGWAGAAMRCLFLRARFCN